MKQTKYNLVKCDKEFDGYHSYDLEDGMVMTAENLDPEVIATYDSLDKALAALKDMECDCGYYDGGPISYLSCTEYWVETVTTDTEDEDDVEYGDEYPGHYNLVKLYDKEEMYSRSAACGFMGLFEARMVDSWIEDKDWLAQKLTDGDHTIVVKSTDGSVLREVKVNIPEI